jgi:zinc transport system substrate-binding protein
MKLILIIVLTLMLLNISTTSAQQNENNETNTQINEIEKKVKVVASFYPFYEIAKEIGGNNSVVSSVIPFGTEPHDWEISPQQIPEITEADMIIYNGIGFDAWLGQEEQFRNSLLVDVSKDLELKGNKQEQQQQQESKNSEHNEETVYDEHNSSYDPHIWLDPILVKNISKTISNALIKLDPNNTDSYKQNTNNFIQKLDALDSLIKKSLSNCELKDFIAFHQAFQYFADRYGLTQHTLHESLLPESEIIPQQIIKIIQLAKNLNIDTIYSEELTDPRLSQTLASEIPNGKVLLLSPIEGISQEEQKKSIGYIDKMHMNLENLREGLKCK